jgi:hypothetical protein
MAALIRCNRNYDGNVAEAALAVLIKISPITAVGILAI